MLCSDVNIMWYKYLKSWCFHPSQLNDVTTKPDERSVTKAVLPWQLIMNRIA